MTYIADTEKRDPLEGPDDFHQWQPWALATNELAALQWLERHDEDGRDYTELAEGYYGDLDAED